MTKDNQSTVLAALVLVQILFGINFITSKIVVTSLDPVLWSNLRFIISGLLLVPMAIFLKRPHPKLDKDFIIPIIYLSLLGMSLGQTLFMIGLKNTTSLNTAIISTTIPILTMLVSIFRRVEKLTIAKLIGILMAFAGVVSIKGIENFNLSIETMKGDLMVFLSALCFAMFLNYSGSFIKKYDNFWSTSWMFFISGFLMLIFNANNFSQLTSITFDLQFIACASFSIIGATVLTYFLNNWALTKISGTNVSLFIYLQPVVAAIIGLIFMGEIISTRAVLSGVMIFSGLLISLRKAE